MSIRLIGLAKQPLGDWQYQYHVYLMQLCNKFLREESLKADISNIWKPVMEKLNLTQRDFRIIADEGLSKFIESASRYSSIFSLRVNGSHICPFGELYKAANNLKEEDAVRSLYRKMGHVYNEWYENYSPSKNTNNIISDAYRRRSISDGSSTYVALDSSSSCIYHHESDANISCFSLFNYNAIMKRGKDAAIFLIDSFDIANDLQLQYGDGYIKYIRKANIDFWQKIYDADPPRFSYNQQPKITVMSAINALPMSSAAITRTCSNVIWSSWFGGYDLLERVDWHPLQGHPVYLFQINVDKKIALERFVRVGEFLSKLPDTNISLVWLERKADPNDLTHNPFKLFSYGEALEEAHNLNIEMDRAQASFLAQYLRDQGRSPRHQGRFLIDPVVRQNSFIILSGLEGSGKSWLAMGLGTAMATRGKLFYDWEVRKKAKVVYLADDEMDDELLDDRREVLRLCRQ